LEGIGQGPRSLAFEFVQPLLERRELGSFEAAVV